MNFEEWYGKEYPVLVEHGVELNFLKKAWNDALEEAAKVADNIAERELDDYADLAATEIAKKIRELK